VNGPQQNCFEAVPAMLPFAARHDYVTVSPTEKILAKYHDFSVALADQLVSCVPAPTQLHVNMTQLVQNWKALQAHAGPDVLVAPTLKAEAYGHGAVATATVLQAAGARMFMVAALREAVDLRRAGITQPILVMSYTPPQQAALAAKLNISLTLFAEESASATIDSLRAASSQALSVHVKVDSGMGRLGSPIEQLPGLASTLLAAGDVLRVQGVYTHFSRADDDEAWTTQQHEAFTAAVAGVFPSTVKVHTCNSAALVRHKHLCGAIARTGIALYGGVASGLTPLPPGMGYALTWSTQVAQVKTLPPGHAIGYGNTYRTTAHEAVATLPVGYSNGLRRGPENQGFVLLHGFKCPIRGRVSMEKLVVGVQQVLDAGVPVNVGDVVLMLGSQPAHSQAAVLADGSVDTDARVEISPADAARAVGTIDYEVLTGLMPASPRWPVELAQCAVEHYDWPQGFEQYNKQY